MIGNCAICRQDKELSFEHIPPRSSGNNASIKIYGVIESLINDDIKPWELDKIKWREINQQGQGYIKLCVQCNNFLGTNYVNKYIDFINQLKNPTSFYRIDNETIQITFNNICPLEIYKQILSMFMTINGDNNLFKLDCTEYLLNIKSQKVPKKLKIYTYINFGSVTRHVPIQVASTNNGNIVTTELGLEPLGFIIYHKHPKLFKIDCTDISFFNNFEFDKVESFSLLLKVKEVNSGISNEFRGKSDFDPL